MARKGKKYGNLQEGNVGTCELCGRQKPLTEHHLIPRAVHRKKHFINRFGKAEMINRKINICRKCHTGIHRIIKDEKDLALHYNTRESLLQDERILKHVMWVSKQR